MSIVWRWPGLGVDDTLQCIVCGDAVALGLGTLKFPAPREVCFFLETHVLTCEINGTDKNSAI